MRVLIIADEIFGTRERSMLSRLEIGLADEGVRVAHALPEGLAGVAGVGPLIEAMSYDATRVPFTRGLRAARLASQAVSIQQAESERGQSQASGRSVDVVHAFGGAAWDLSLDVARRIGSAIAFEVWRMGLVDRAVSISRRDPQVQRVFLAPDITIERRLKAAGLTAVRAAPWGVHAIARTRPAVSPDRSVSIVITGGGRDARATLAALEGVGLATSERADAVIFMDAMAARRSRAWSVAKRLGLLGRLSLIDDIEMRRDIALRADILVQPEAVGEQRSVLLDAMAAGMVVVAAADPGVSWLVDDKTAWLVDEHTPRVWANTIARALSDPARARALAARASAQVAQEHRATSHVASVLGAYEWVVGGPRARVGPRS
ncbi:MAG: glycosyltransferase [Phycisphaeraceae bacterium]|nr:MAG: glycosyltransferase [Phycisphaeraceae bacterium]